MVSSPAPGGTHSDRNHFRYILPLPTRSFDIGFFPSRSLHRVGYLNVEKTLRVAINNVNSTAYRWKHTKKKSVQQEVESDSDDEEEVGNVDETDDKISKVTTTTVTSLRVDLILKAGLGIARNKVEAMFYESKIRVNGEKILKKSYQCKIGDEVDIIRGTSPANPEFLVVSRVEILSAAEKAERLAVKLRRYKSLVIENYAEPWKSSQDGQ